MARSCRCHIVRTHCASIWIAEMGTMTVRWTLCAVLLAGLFARVVTGDAAYAQSDADLQALNQQVEQLHRAGKYDAATRIAEQYVAAARKRHGEQHTEYAKAILWLGRLLVATNRHVAAEPLFRRALEIDEENFGPEHTVVARDLFNLGHLLMVTNRRAEAEPLMRRGLSIDEKSFGPEHILVGGHLTNLAQLLHDTTGWPRPSS